MDEPSPGNPREFATTRWSVIRAAKQGSGEDSSITRIALEELCRIYWYPLYVFVRRQGHAHYDAEDLTQAFFARLLAKGDLAGVDRAKGKFRSFLLASMKHFLANEWDYARAQKRGGGRPTLSIDFQDAESRYAVEPAHEITPDKLYERRWAMTVLDQAMEKLRAEMRDAGKENQFEELKIFMTGGKGEVSYASVAETLNISEGAVKVAVHRLRKRYRQLLCEEVAHTVDEKDEVEDELRSLLSALAG
jgi:RNA polymerase sigma-70 factor (ECF subfamily)